MQARSKREALELQRQEALRLGNSGQAFALKFTIRETEQEAERADRKAARMYYKGKYLTVRHVCADPQYTQRGTYTGLLVKLTYIS